MCCQRFLDGNSLKQSSLKVKSDGIVVHIEPPPSTEPNVSDLVIRVSEFQWSDFVREVRDAHKAGVQRIDTLAVEMKFLRDLVIGPITPVSVHTGPSATTSNPTDLDELVDAVVRSAGADGTMDATLDARLEQRRMTILTRPKLFSFQ